MATHVTDAVLVHADAAGRGTRAELAARMFLSRYGVASTRKSYTTCLVQWFGWCGERDVDPLTATRAHLEMFTRELELTRCRATVAGKLHTLSAFYKMAVIDEVVDRNPMLHVNRPKIERKSTTNGLTRTEFADVLRAAEALGLLEHALVCVLGLNGMRVTEACGIDLDDVVRERGSQNVTILRKGGATQTLPLAAPRATWAVEQLIGSRQSGPLFVNPSSGERMDRRSAGRVVQRVMRQTTITKRITPHSFRHTFITLSRNAGVPDRDIAASAGHTTTRNLDYYDRAREVLARNATHALSAWVESAA